MEIKVLKHEKDEFEFEIDNLTLAELLRVYLNKDSSVTFTAWKKEHPTKNPIVVVKTKGKSAKRAINDAVEDIEKELAKAESDFKNMK